MALTDNAKNYIKKAFWAYSPLKETDPEFYEFFYNFAYDEVQNFGDLDEKTGYLSVLAVLLGCGGFDEFKVMLPAALNFGVTPEEAREVVYQATAYLGLGRFMSSAVYAVTSITVSKVRSFSLSPILRRSHLISFAPCGCGRVFQFKT